MTQLPAKRFVMEDRLTTEINTINGSIATINANAARGTSTQYKVTTLTALDAIADAVIGDLAYVTTPGTGIESIKFEAFAGTGLTIDWHIVDTVRADTVVNLDAFIAAIAAISDETFVIGGLAYVSGTQAAYKFITTAGVKQPLSAIVPIVPTSVSGTGSALSPNGQITLTAATSLVVNGCFSSSFDNYVAVIDIASVSASNSLNMQLRTGGTTATAAVYDTESNYVYGATVVGVQVLAGTSWAFCGSGGITGTSHSAEVKLYAPALSQATRAISDAMSTSNPMSAVATGGSIQKRAMLHRTVASYDGFVITPSTGNVTGTVRIYGYNNLNGA
jgi:hypothetical protein